jgi:hypothetical protein
LFAAQLKIQRVGPKTKDFVLYHEEVWRWLGLDGFGSRGDF